MRRALGRGGWALSIPAVLTLTVAAAAQPAGPAPAGAAAKVPQQQSAAARRPVTEDPNRVREITVELAWLADPVTFPYRFGARVAGSTVEIRGYVPSAAVRDRALKVASQQCPLTLVDRLTINPATAAPAVGVRVEQLYTAVVHTLKISFPVQARTLSVQCRPYGQVVLSGTVSSFEEKLAVSVSLRRLPGCTSVVNQLNVGSGVRPPAPPTVATKPSAVQPKAPYTAQAPTQQNLLAFQTQTPAWSGASMAGQNNSRPFTTTTSPYNSSPFTATTSPYNVSMPPLGTALPFPKSGSELNLGPAVGQTVPAAASKPAALQPKGQATTQIPAQTAGPTSQTAAPALGQNNSRPSLTTASPYNSQPPLGMTNPPRWNGQPAPSTALGASSTTPAVSGVQKTAAASSLPVLDRKSERPTQAARTQGLPAVASTALNPAPAPSGSSPRAAASTAPRPKEGTTGVVQAARYQTSPPATDNVRQVSASVVREPAPRPADTVVPAAYSTWTPIADTVRQTSNVVRGPHPATLAAAPPAFQVAAVVPVAGQPYVTTGVMLVSEPEPVGGTGGIAPRKTAAQAVQEACGPGARDVEVVFRSPSQVVVRLRASSKAAADRFAGLILALPELAAYHKEMEIKAPQ